MTRCSLLIRCYNEEKHIEKLLKGILEQTESDLEILLVDSGSTDNTVAIASKYPVKIISIKPEEFSFGRALNIGCQEARGEFIVIASAHVYPVYRDWLEHLLAPFSDLQVALTYGKQQGNEYTKYSEHQVFAKWFPKQSDFEQPHPFCNNANAAIRRSLWNTIPYNESLTGLEDLDWAKRAQQLGYKVAYVADAPIVHVHEETSARVYNRYRREAIALKQILPQEQFRFRDFLRFFIGNTISDYFHAWHDGVLIRELKNILVFRLMQFWGTYQGFHDLVNNQLKQTFYYPNQMVRFDSDRKAHSDRLIDYASILSERQLEKQHY
ncbi:MAG: glycosyltransferase [Pleurocapsa sp.]